MGWTKSLPRFFSKMLWKNPKELLGQPNTSLPPPGNSGTVPKCFITGSYFPQIITKVSFFKKCLVPTLHQLILSVQLYIRDQEGPQAFEISVTDPERPLNRGEAEDPGGSRPPSLCSPPPHCPLGLRGPACSGLSAQ